jgi:glycosyltransferase involved in cell wall biosynthesis
MEGRKLRLGAIAYSSYYRAHRGFRRVRYNYYFKNWKERKQNTKLLTEMRKNYAHDYDDTNPLVSVCIPTFNRCELLTKRTIHSVLNQTYQNFEIIIVGDHCTDDTEKMIREFDDDRLLFYNLPKRGKYPINQRDRWCVAGVIPANKALELSNGAWIASLDDDDEFSEDHIERLLNYASKNRYEMVFGKVNMEIKPNKWVEVGSSPLQCGKISRISTLYNSALRFFTYDINSWKYNEPADWNMWRRMKEAGVNIGFIDHIVGKHYLEKTQFDGK